MPRAVDRCPGCRRLVRLLPPRHLDHASDTVLSWRRQAHATTTTGLSAEGAVRCRYPTALTPEEIPRGTMDLIMFTKRLASELAPGDLVAHERGPTVVDEVRHTLTGTTAYGRDPGVVSGQRRTMRFEPGQLAEVLPTYDDANSVWSQIMWAVDTTPADGDLAAAPHGLAALEPAEARPTTCHLGGRDGEIIVTLNGQLWSVYPDVSDLADVEPPPPTE